MAHYRLNSSHTPAANVITIALRQHKFTVEIIYNTLYVQSNVSRWGHQNDQLIRRLIIPVRCMYKYRRTSSSRYVLRRCQKRTVFAACIKRKQRTRHLQHRESYDCLVNKYCMIRSVFVCRCRLATVNFTRYSSHIVYLYTMQVDIEIGSLIVSVGRVLFRPIYTDFNLSKRR